MIAGLRATNETLTKQDISNVGLPIVTQNIHTDITSGVSNGASEKKDTIIECHDQFQPNFTKETTTSTSM